MTTTGSAWLDFLIGLIVSVLASVMNALGLNLLKLDHVRNSSLAQHRQKKDCGRPMWHIGLYLYVGSQIAGSTIALNFLKTQWVAPLGSVALIFNFVFAKMLVGTRITRQDILGTAVVMIAVIWIVLFGNNKKVTPPTLPSEGATGPGTTTTTGAAAAGKGGDIEDSLSIEELKHLFNRPIFIFYFSILNVVIASLLVLGFYANWAIGYEGNDESGQTRRRAMKRRLIRWFGSSPWSHRSKRKTSSATITEELEEEEIAARVAAEAAAADAVDAQVLAEQIHAQVLEQQQQQQQQDGGGKEELDLQKQPTPPLELQQHFQHQVQQLTHQHPPHQRQDSVSILDEKQASREAKFAAARAAAAVERVEKMERAKDVRLKKWVAMIMSGCGGLLASETLLLAKSGVKLASISVTSGHNQFRDYVSWVILVSLVLTAVLQVVCLNVALKLYDSVLVVPTFYGFYTAFGLVNATIFLNQFSSYEPWILFLITLGIGVLIYGVRMLSAPKPNVATTPLSTDASAQSQPLHGGHEGDDGADGEDLDGRDHNENGQDSPGRRNSVDLEKKDSQKRYLDRIQQHPDGTTVMVASAGVGASMGAGGSSIFGQQRRRKVGDSLMDGSDGSTTRRGTGSTGFLSRFSFGASAATDRPMTEEYTPQQQMQQQHHPDNGKPPQPPGLAMKGNIAGNGSILSSRPRAPSPAAAIGGGGDSRRSLFEERRRKTSLPRIDTGVVLSSVGNTASAPLPRRGRPETRDGYENRSCSAAAPSPTPSASSYSSATYGQAGRRNSLAMDLPDRPMSPSEFRAQYTNSPFPAKPKHLQDRDRARSSSPGGPFASGGGGSLNQRGRSVDVEASSSGAGEASPKWSTGNAKLDQVFEDLRNPFRAAFRGRRVSVHGGELAGGSSLSLGSSLPSSPVRAAFPRHGRRDSSSSGLPSEWEETTTSRRMRHSTLFGENGSRSSSRSSSPAPGGGIRSEDWNQKHSRSQSLDVGGSPPMATLGRPLPGSPSSRHGKNASTGSAGGLSRVGGQPEMGSLDLLPGPYGNHHPYHRYHNPSHGRQLSFTTRNEHGIMTAAAMGSSSLGLNKDSVGSTTTAVLTGTDPLMTNDKNNNNNKATSSSIQQQQIQNLQQHQHHPTSQLQHSMTTSSSVSTIHSLMPSASSTSLAGMMVVGVGSSGSGGSGGSGGCGVAGAIGPLTTLGREKDRERERERDKARMTPSQSSVALS